MSLSMYRCTHEIIIISTILPNVLESLYNPSLTQKTNNLLLVPKYYIFISMESEYVLLFSPFGFFFFHVA